LKSWNNNKIRRSAVGLIQLPFFREEPFNRALEIDPDCADAHDGLGAPYRGRGRSEEAVQEHMQSIALLHYRPQTHINLGLALAESRKFDSAIRAFEVAIEQDANNPFPPPLPGPSLPNRQTRSRQGRHASPGSLATYRQTPRRPNRGGGCRLR